MIFVSVNVSSEFRRMNTVNPRQFELEIDGKSHFGRKTYYILCITMEFGHFRITNCQFRLERFCCIYDALFD